MPGVSQCRPNLLSGGLDGCGGVKDGGGGQGRLPAKLLVLATGAVGPGERRLQLVRTTSFFFCKIV